MIDGAIRTIASIPTSDQKVNLGSQNERARSSSKERGTDFSSQSKKESFQEKLDKKLDRPESPETTASAINKNREKDSDPDQLALAASKTSTESQGLNPVATGQPQVTRNRVSTEDRLMAPQEAMPISPELSLFAMKQANSNEPVLEFMDSMESEFGIEPDRLVAAFGGLSDSQLMQTPEDSMEVYLKQLNIPEGDMGDAEQMYEKLLNAMRFQKVGRSDNTKLIPLELQSALSEMKTLDQPVVLGHQSVDAMNKKFFDVYPDKFGRSISEDPYIPGQKLSSNSFMPNAQGEFPSQGGKIGTPAQSLSTEELLWAKRAQDTPVVTTPATAEDSDAGLWSLGASLGGAAAKVANDAAAGTGAGASSLDAADADVPDWMAKLAESSGDTSIDSNELAAKDTQFSDDSGQSAEGEFEFNQSQANLNPALNAKGEDNKFAKVLAMGGAAAGDAGANPEADGLESMVKNVQLLSQKGGGEMKVQLNQEGLGDVQLKVAVNEGKVDIQMLTANKDAKKLIESEIGLLKTELGEKKIELNEIKVEVTKDIRNQLDQQLADQKREETRQFWNQFKQENDAKRAMALNTGINSYQSKDPNSISDRRENSDAYRESGNDGRLNIVA